MLHGEFCHCSDVSPSELWSLCFRVQGPVSMFRVAVVGCRCGFLKLGSSIHGGFLHSGFQLFILQPLVGLSRT